MGCDGIQRNLRDKPNLSYVKLSTGFIIYPKNVLDIQILQDHTFRHSELTPVGHPW